MPAQNVSVSATFEPAEPEMTEVVNYDFDSTGSETTFADKGNAARGTNSVTDGNDADVNKEGENQTKVLKVVTADGSSGNSSSGNGLNRLLDFTAQVKNATAIKVEFDSFSTGGRFNFSLVDVSKRDSLYGSIGVSSLNDTGILYTQGVASSDNNYKIQSNGHKTASANEWLHTVVNVDYKTKKISYTVTSVKEDGSVNVTDENVDYLDTTASYATGLEIRNWAINNKAAIDNIKVSITKGETATVTINYQDAEGHTLKTPTTDENAIKTLPYTAAESTHKSFKATDIEGKDYWCVYDAGSTTDTISAVSDEDSTIDLKFTTTEYAKTPITVQLDKAASEDVTVDVDVSGTATLSDAEGATVNQKLQIKVTSGSNTATDETLKLLPGEYTYTVTPVKGYKLTGGYSGTIEEGQTNTLSFETDEREVATVAVNYTYGGQTVKSVNVELDESGPYVNQQYTLPEKYYKNVSYKVTAKDDPNVDDVKTTYRNYYVEEEVDSSSFNITPTQATGEENKIEVPVKYDGNEYYYEEDFESYEDGNALLAAGWSSSNDNDKISIQTDNTKYLQRLGASGGRGVRYTFSEEAQASGQYNISFDTKMKSHSYGGSALSFYDATMNTSNTINWSSGLGGAILEMTTHDWNNTGTIISGTNFASEKPWTFAKDQVWCHFDVTVNSDSNVAYVKVTEVSGGSPVWSGAAIMGGSAALKYIHVVGERGGGGYADVDNIKVYVPTSIPSGETAKTLAVDTSAISAKAGTASSGTAKAVFLDEKGFTTTGETVSWEVKKMNGTQEEEATAVTIDPSSGEVNVTEAAAADEVYRIKATAGELNGYYDITVAKAE